MKMFYTYMWLRENGIPYYVGKGSGQRAFIQHKHIVPKPPRDRILLQYFPDEEAALFAEEILIAYYGRECDGGCLLNLSPGGLVSVGRKGQTLSEEHKHKIRLALIGNKNGLGNKGNIGKKASLETRAKLSFVRRGHKLTPEGKERCRQNALGNKHSLGRACTEEAKTRISIANTGRKRSEDAKAKMRAAWIRRKARA